MSRAWEGDWRERIMARLRMSGYRTVTELVASRPTARFEDLARELGKDVAPVQVRNMYRDEARTDPRGAFERYARSCLAIEIRDLMPKGWGVDEFEAIHAFGVWSADLDTETEEHDAAAERVYDALEELAPTGWVPDGPDDPILLKAFERWTSS